MINDANSSQQDNYEDESFLGQSKSGLQHNDNPASLTHDSFKPGTPVDTSNLFMFDFGNL